MSDAASHAEPHGDMPESLRKYWLEQPWWGQPGDYYTCLTKLGKEAAKHHLDIDVHGVCGNLHEEATGMSTAEHTKLLTGKGKDHPSTTAEVHAAKARGRL
jgi:hypothetical protein